MLTFVLAIIVVVLLIAGMAIGVILGRKPLAGSCGGIGDALGEAVYECELCGGDPNKCENEQLDEKISPENFTDLACDATARKDK